MRPLPPAPEILRRARERLAQDSSPPRKKRPSMKAPREKCRRPIRGRRLRLAADLMIPPKPPLPLSSSRIPPTAGDDPDGFDPTLRRVRRRRRGTRGRARRREDRSNREPSRTLSPNGAGARELRRDEPELEAEPELTTRARSLSSRSELGTTLGIELGAGARAGARIRARRSSPTATTASPRRRPTFRRCWSRHPSIRRPRRSSSRESPRRSARPARSTASTSRFRPAPSTASSDPTVRERRRRCR